MILFRDEVKVKGRNSARESELPEPECSRVPVSIQGFLLQVQEKQELAAKRGV